MKKNLSPKLSLKTETVRNLLPQTNINSQTDARVSSSSTTGTRDSQR